MMDNIEEVAALLHIHREASAHGETLKHIKDAAMNKLRQINDAHVAPKAAELVQAAAPPLAEPPTAQLAKAPIDILKERLHG